MFIDRDDQNWYEKGLAGEHPPAIGTGLLYSHPGMVFGSVSADGEITLAEIFNFPGFGSLEAAAVNSSHTDWSGGTVEFLMKNGVYASREIAVSQVSSVLNPAGIIGYSLGRMFGCQFPDFSGRSADEDVSPVYTVQESFTSAPADLDGYEVGFVTQAIHSSSMAAEVSLLDVVPRSSFEYDCFHAGRMSEAFESIDLTVADSIDMHRAQFLYEFGKSLPFPYSDLLPE